MEMIQKNQIMNTIRAEHLIVIVRGVESEKQSRKPEALK